jgi:DNA-binding MurR/RpiR family transcriptional regulator
MLYNLAQEVFVDELNEFRHRLENHFARLTKSEQRIASFLLSDHDQAAFLSAAEIAEHLAISEATVVRFAKSIGYSSFPELRRSLQNIFRVRVTPSTRLQRKLADLKTSGGHILPRVVDMELQYLADVSHTVSTSDFDRAVKLVLKAQHIFIFGSGPSRILAELFQIRLQRFGFRTTLLTESGRDIIDKLLLLRGNDVLFAAGFLRVTNELVAAIDQAHQVGCKVVLLTDTLATHFKEQADVILSARRGPVSTFHSLTVPMAILNALILAIAMDKSETSVASLDRLQALRTEYGLDNISKTR